MATVSAIAHTNGQYDSRREQEGEPDPWDLSRPDPNPPPSSYKPVDLGPHQKLNFNPSPQPINGTVQPPQPTRTPDNNTYSKQAANLDLSYLTPPREIRPTPERSHSGSEADSLIDLYGRRRSADERSRDGDIHNHEPAAQPGMSYIDDEDPESSRWIHRDKLAIIESQEMREAGIKLPSQPTRSLSRSKARHQRDKSEEQPELPKSEPETPAMKAPKKQRTRSLEREEEEEDTLVNDFDLRKPEEIAAENALGSSPGSVYSNPYLRKSSSRIPLPKSSNVPIPQQHLERETPLPRKRGHSNNWNSDDSPSLVYPKTRSRSNSLGSQNLLDDPEIYQGSETPTSTSRPASASSPSKVFINKSSHTRRPSVTTLSQNPTSPHSNKPRSTSATASPNSSSNPGVRPKSRSGLESRPPTAVNRPEGDPPWLATMYKPDPRLPPEQQLIPTHAKRLQQQQWEQEQKEQKEREAKEANAAQKGGAGRGGRINTEGKASPQLPREFSPLAEHTVNGLQPSSRDADEKTLQERPQSQSPQRRGVRSEWPLQQQQQQQQAGYNPATGSSPPIAGSKPSGAADERNTATHPSAGAYNTLSPHTNQQQQQQQQRGASGLRQPLDPFEREKLERARAAEKNRYRDREKMDGDEEKGERKDQQKEAGCGGCCVVM